MSVFVDLETRLLVQGITGRDGSFHTRQMIAYGTKVVAGVTPGKGGQPFDGVVPVFDTVADAVRETRANATVIYVPAALAASAMYEAADAGMGLIVCITEGIPVLDMTKVLPYVHERGARLIGPNCPGLISPTQSKVGIIPGNICKPGRVGVVSRSGTMTCSGFRTSLSFTTAPARAARRRRGASSPRCRPVRTPPFFPPPCRPSPK